MSCPFNGDISNDCQDCAYSADYHYQDGECVEREQPEEEVILNPEIATLSKETRVLLQEAWLQAEELEQDFEACFFCVESNGIAEIEEALLQEMYKRAQAIMKLLHHMVPEDLSEEEAADPGYILSKAE